MSLSISTIALSAEDVAAPIALTDALKSAITDNPSVDNVTALVTANLTSAVAITSAAIAANPDSAAAITAAAITAAPDNTIAIIAAAITAPGIKGNPTLAAAITAAAIKANPSLAANITAAALIAAPNSSRNAIAAAAFVATQEVAGLTQTVAISNSSQSTINNQALQAQTFARAINLCSGNPTCIDEQAAIMVASSSLTPVEIKAVENSLAVESPNSP